MTEELPSANMFKKPFVTYTLDEDKEESNSETITLRINKEQRELIELLKVLFNYSQDAKVIKIALRVCRNVALANFGADVLEELTEGGRRRPIKEYRIEAGKIVKM
jgi:hypothetical protein